MRSNMRIITSTAMKRLAAVIAVCCNSGAVLVNGFLAPSRHISPSTTLSTRQSASSIHMMMDPSSTAAVMDSANTLATAMADASSATASTLMTAFADQGQNLAGIFFQASLLPYLLFIYFLQYRANRLGSLANFGFQFVLLFVLSTIPSGIISKANYGNSLADTDWLHGGAEALLTLANIFIVLGLKESMTKPEPMPAAGKPRTYGFAAFGLFALLCATGPGLLGIGPHAPFLFGLGNLPADFVTTTFPWVVHSEPVNALSIPTWAIHFSSVFEYLFAMNLVWRFAANTENETWKGLTWGMLPLHASGICACTYHFFYNPSQLQFLVTSQAGLTLLGNITCMIAAFRIAKSNGWTVQELNPLALLGGGGNSPTSPQGLVADGLAMKPLVLNEPQESNRDLALKLVALTLVSSYVMKYGELGLNLPFIPNAPVAASMIIGIPAITAAIYYQKSKAESVVGEDGESSFRPFENLPFLSKSDDDKEEGGGLSMDDIKKYGVAGTVAYILTELAFWIVAFPVAATALYQSTGHWPDVLNDNTDRAAVLAFIFAGANVARLLVPLRLGAALALAPWVDENVLSRFGGGDGDSDGQEMGEEGFAVDVEGTPAESSSESRRQSRI